MNQKRWPALLALALGAVAIGLTEFVPSGLLPQIAGNLLGDEYTRSPSDAVAHAGWMVTIYALGVVAGAPLIAALTARMPRKRLVLGLLVLFVAGTVASALAPTFGLVLTARFVAGLPHGAYFGAAGLLAASLMGPGSEGRGFAAVLSGLTISNVVGVPAITRLGQEAGWRVAYLVIAGVFALALLAVAATVPDAPAAGGSPAAELRSLRRGQVWLVAATGAIGFAGFFAVNSYIAPVTTEVTGLSAGTVPWVLVAVGLGMTAGNALGGWYADRDLRRATLIGFTALIAAVAFFGLAAPTTIGLFTGAFLIGASSLFLGPALQARLIAVAPGAQLMGAAVNQSAMNIANSLGAALGGAVIAAGLGYRAPAWVGIALGAVGLILATVSFALDRSTPAPEPALH
ncbi:DHA1 family inner membrane transport protein [Actinoplanes octamycinicus]|uniref:DHA1 family inner membrane transport protein n=1 Tax=Actinoplanes octamycinicus TaxID=135948 RepID=A0A7W7MA46_9ACTN|nr:MFS transporter [Actinoplanes octamycinicus]MBB4742470.1 DHA1 family inner membrane transport protein [Actinoplanes octamycinicus]GIE60808.1 MFS transporter [Actinoplanes octamycinicus]